MSPLPIGPIQSTGSMLTGVNSQLTATNLAADLNALNIPQGTKFSDMLGSFVSSVEELGQVASGTKDAFLNGQDIDLHEVMIAGEESGIAFDLLLEVRNRLVEAYKELMRMPL